MNTATHKVMNHTPVLPVDQDNTGIINPNATRYGWCPFKTISLVGALGSIDYYIQPNNSPYFRELPKNQLIPFESFPIISYIPDENVLAQPGKPAPLIPQTRAKSAAEAATELIRPYGSFGYTVLNSLEGKSQEDAFRIFAVVMPFDYKLGELSGELLFGAEERIKADSVMEFDLGNGTIHAVEPLRDEAERSIARRLVSEMAAAVSIAESFSRNRLKETQKEIIASFGGKPGRSSADDLDVYIAGELMEEVPAFEKGSNGNSDLERKVDFLVESEQAKRDKEEIARLKEENARLMAGQKAEESEKISYKIGDTVSAAGKTGVVMAKPFGKYKVKFEDGETATLEVEELN